MTRLMIILYALLFFVTPGQASPKVHSKYVHGSGNAVTLQVSVPRPAPTALLFTQKVQGGQRLVSARPAPVGGKLSGSTLKWLFKRPRPGALSIHMQFAKPVRPGQLQGFLNYRDPATGSRVHLQVGN